MLSSSAPYPSPTSPQQPSELDPPDTATPFPCYRLLTAILERAIVDTKCSHYDIRPKDKRSATNWISSTSTKKWSFHWVCTELSLIPSVVRKRINLLHPDEISYCKSHTRSVDAIFETGTFNHDSMGREGRFRGNTYKEDRSEGRH